MWATRCCWQTDSKAPRTLYAAKITGGLIQKWQHVKKFSSSCSLLMWLGHLLLFSILSFLRFPTNLPGLSPFSCKWLQPALCFPECVSSQTFPWEYDLQCNSLSPFPWRYCCLLKSQHCHLFWLFPYFSMNKNKIYGNRIAAVLKTYPVVQPS